MSAAAIQFCRLVIERNIFQARNAVIDGQDSDLDPPVQNSDLDFIWRGYKKLETRGWRNLAEAAQPFDERRGVIGDRIVDHANGQLADQMPMCIVNLSAELIYG